MDKEQAIKVLKPLVNSYVDYANITMKEEDDDIVEALEMAVDALKTQLFSEGTTKGTTSDTISRQAAIDAIVNCTNCGDEKTLRAYVTKHNLDNGWTGGVLEAIDAIEDLPPAQPDLNEWCTDCREYDKERHCCPRWNRVIRKTVEDMKAAQSEPKWIPVSERLPEDLAEVITTWVNRDPLPYYEFMRDKPFTAVSVHYKGEWYWYSSTCADYLEEYGRSDRDKVDKSIEIIAWMPLPEAYEPNK